MKSFFNKIRQFSRNIKIILPLTGRKIGLWKWDIKNNEISINDFWLEKLGYKKTTRYTMDYWMSNVHPDDREKIKESLQNYIQNWNSDGLEFEYRLKRSNGEYIWLFLNGQVTKYKNGRPARMDGIIFDITGQKQIENELYSKNSEIEALYEESEAQNEEMAAIMDELQNNQMELEGANNRLKISETKFRKIFENSPIGIIQSSMTGRVLDANNAFCGIFGYESLDDLIKNLENTSLLYSGNGTRSGIMDKLSKTDVYHALNLTATKKDQSQIYVNAYLLKMTDEFTGEKYLTTFVEDITRLKSSQFERDLFFNNSGDLLSITDFNGELKQINAAWSSDLGWDLEELKKMNIYDLIHPDDRIKTGEFRERLRNSDKVLTLTNRYRTIKNDYRIIRWSSMAFRDINLVFSIGRDETERYEAELELKQMWDRLDIALKVGVIGLWDLDLTNDSLRINTNMTELIGLESNYIRPASKTWKNYIHKDDFPSSMEAMNKLLTKQTETYTDEYRARMSDGKYRWFFSRGKVVEYDPDGNPVRVAGSVMDITEQKEAEIKRIQLELKMQQAQKLESLGVLAGGIAHDFNNLLTGILGNSDILLYELPQNVEIQQRIIEIKRATKLASELTNQMLAYSGKGSFIIEHIDLNDLIIDMNSLLEASISKKVKLSYTLSPELPGIKGDATQIRQIVMNLILNGSDAIENNGTIDVTTSAVRLTQSDLESLTINYNLVPGDFTLLEVRDSGCGIENEKLKQIFDPFFTTKFTGRGLGLAAVSGIIRSHNAGLLVKSVIGEGTCFQIYFPVSLEASGPDKEIKEKHPAFTNKNLTVLIADDEKYIRDLTTKMLNISGYKVHLARNGREAIEVFSKKKDEISCILMDLTMPELDGREALAEIRRIDPDIPIIITSGYCEHDIISRFTNEKISGFLQKPYNLEDIISAIENAVS
jgi:PAS domain S-box-containing protein